MSDPVAFLSTAELTTAGFAAFIAELGGTLDPGCDMRATLTEGDRHAWLYLSPEAARDALEEHGDALLTALGSEPVSAVVAEASRDPSGHEIVLRAAAAFAARFPKAAIDEAGSLTPLSSG